jgi:hypothetical protein
MGMYLLAFLLCLVGLVLLFPASPLLGRHVGYGWVGWLLIAAGVLVQLFATSGSLIHW